MYLAISVSVSSDDTRMPLTSWVMAALCHPNAIAKAREDGDAVCGGMVRRLPGTGDIPKMPYTCAPVKEVLRWRPPMPTISQHQLTQDLEFEDYYLLARTEFLMNLFPNARDGDGPDAFRPERWMDSTVTSFVAFARLLYCFGYTPVSLTHTIFSCNADNDRLASTIA